MVLILGAIEAVGDGEGNTWWHVLGGLHHAVPGGGTHGVGGIEEVADGEGGEEILFLKPLLGDLGVAGEDGGGELHIVFVAKWGVADVEYHADIPGEGELISHAEGESGLTIGDPLLKVPEVVADHLGEAQGEGGLPPLDRRAGYHRRRESMVWRGVDGLV